MFNNIDLDTLKEEFDIAVTVNEGKLYCTDYKNIFFEIETLAERICYWLEKYDCFADYCIDTCNSFFIELF